MKADIAIVVPVLNEVAVLPAQIRRLQAIPGIQAVFVDGGSSDGSRQLLEKSGVHWLSAEPGRAVQMNAGARACHGDTLIFLHADTLLESRHVD
ncbi:MAG: glycosyltransferase, partial [Mariprofundaceae bacterium]|nr:glycosyltransferase [Mariprofundaceae bacterium]